MLLPDVAPVQRRNPLAIEQLHRFRAVLREQVAQRPARLLLEPIEQRRLADAVEPEIPEADAHLAPRRERPRLAPEEHAERPHGALRCLAAFIGMYQPS